MRWKAPGVFGAEKWRIWTYTCGCRLERANTVQGDPGEPIAVSVTGDDGIQSY